MEHIGIGIQQSLSGKKKSSMKLHSEAHLLADEITSSWNEPKKFSMYLGVIKRIGIARARALFSDLNQRPDLPVSSKARIFMWNARKPSQPL
ncbi:MAG TPA: hypothetical protein VJB93_03615 [Patescibacteria group bacterium]|nr:hypothetical protein [Patescibacteria group bacterium]